jgi:hypothetical protein
MRAKELLDCIRVRTRRVGRNQCIEELQQPFHRARRKVVDRMPDDVGVNVLAKVKAHRNAARTGTLRVVVGNGRNSRKIREADRHGSGTAVQMRRPRQRRGFRRRRKRAPQQDTLGMCGSKPGMNTTINFVEHLDRFSAQRQEFFVRRQRHGSILRPVTLPSTTDTTGRGDYISHEANRSARRL